MGVDLEDMLSNLGFKIRLMSLRPRVAPVLCPADPRPSLGKLPLPLSIGRLQTRTVLPSGRLAFSVPPSSAFTPNATCVLVKG